MPRFEPLHFIGKNAVYYYYYYYRVIIFLQYFLKIY
jgi:hypothetical protein